MQVTDEQEELGGGGGVGLMGCLADSFVHVSSVLGARTEEIRIWQAFP